MRRLAVLLLAPLLSGCISVHPPEQPRMEGHAHAGRALHAGCNPCAAGLGGFVQSVIAKLAVQGTSPKEQPKQAAKATPEGPAE